MDENKKVPYMDFILKRLELIGYVPGVNFRGATYDWRKGTYELILDGEFKRIQNLIEETFAKN